MGRSDIKPTHDQNAINSNKRSREDNIDLDVKWRREQQKRLNVSEPEPERRDEGGGNRETSEVPNNLNIRNVEKDSLYNFFIINTNECIKEIDTMLSHIPRVRAGNFNETIRQIKSDMIDSLKELRATRRKSRSKSNVDYEWTQICALRTNADWLAEKGHEEGNLALNKLKFDLYSN